jgi:hypothetical protein
MPALVVWGAIPKSGNRFSGKITPNRYQHDPEKLALGLDPGREPAFGKDHAQRKWQ